jgi:hypothetical protein
MNRKRLEAPFAPEQIRQRQGDNGTMLQYIEAHAVIQRLNDVLAGNWSFEVVDYQVREEISEVIVLGRLTTGHLLKMQVGGARLKRDRGHGEPLCLADDIKAAASDALKKCATLLGVGLHLYRQEGPSGERAQQSDQGAPVHADESTLPSPPDTPPLPQQSSRRHSETARLTKKQHQLILRLASDLGLSREQLSDRCQKDYGRGLEHLSKTDASYLIDALFTGKAQVA